MEISGPRRRKTNYGMTIRDPRVEWLSLLLLPASEDMTQDMGSVDDDKERQWRHQWTVKCWKAALPVEECQ